MDDQDNFAATSVTASSDPLTQDDVPSDVELTAHEYARECGLCTDYLTERPTDVLQSWEPSETPAQDMEDPTGAAKHEVTTDDLFRERLDVDLEARELLYWMMKDEDDLFLRTLPEIELSPVDLKIELPLLETDHELDVLRFGHRLSPDFANLNLPMERTEREKDESMEWPIKYRDLPQKVERKYRAEKLEFPRAGVEFLMDVMKDSWGVKDMEELYANEIVYTKNRALEPVTPPLLPLSPRLTAFEPDSDAAELELLSESTIPGAAEAEEVNAQLSKKDRILPPGIGTSDEIYIDNTDDLFNLYSPLLSILESNTSSPPRKRKVNDLKVEVPLTPQNPNSFSPAKKVKRVTFPEMLHEYAPDVPIIVDASQPMRNSDESVEAFFNDVIEPMALEANRSFEQEQLQEADSLYRPTVPLVDFTCPIPPWKAYGRKGNGKDIAGATEFDMQRRLLRDVKRNDLKQFSSWTGGSKIERQLPWSPFPPELGKIEFDDGVASDERAVQYLQQIMDFMSLEDLVISDNLTWKPDGLRILDDLCESEDELEEMDMEEPEPKDIEALVRKGTREFGDEQPVAEHRPVQRPFEMSVRSRDGPPRHIGNLSYEQMGNQAIASSIQLKVSVPRIGQLRTEGIHLSDPYLDASIPDPLMRTRSGPVQPISNDVGLFGTTFSTATALSNFMQNMGKTSNNLDVSVSVSVSKLAPAPKASAPVLTTTSISKVEPVQSPEQPYPYPPLPDNPPSAFFILSTTLLQNQRPLVRAIGRLYPSANYVERDFATLPEASEADILLSPATGLIITTLQKIKQRALPGQKIQLSGIRERLVNLSLRYERLIALVGEGAAEGSAGRVMDERDCEALAEFGGFAAGLDADVQVSYVPGTEKDLVKWVVGCMVRYCLTSVRGQEVRLLQDETLWEQLLRRIGLNAFAAQLILAELKATMDTDVSMQDASSSSFNDSSANGHKDFGIRAFIRMDPQERIRRFESLLGGRKVLARVTKALEQKWLSAVNGFRQPTQL